MIIDSITDRLVSEEEERAQVYNYTTSSLYSSMENLLSGASTTESIVHFNNKSKTSIPKKNTGT